MNGDRAVLYPPTTTRGDPHGDQKVNPRLDRPVTLRHRSRDLHHHRCNRRHAALAGVSGTRSTTARTRTPAAERQGYLGARHPGARRHAGQPGVRPLRYPHPSLNPEPDVTDDRAHKLFSHLLSFRVSHRTEESCTEIPRLRSG